MESSIVKIALVSSGKSMFAEIDKSIVNIDFKRLEEHILGLDATLLLLDEVVLDEVAPKEKKKPFYQTLHKHPKFVRK